MKKLFTAILFLSAIFTGVKAQQEVLFKIKILPNHNYSSTMKMNMDMNMNYEGGDTATANKLKASGMKMPMLMQMENTMQLEIKTGAFGATQQFPFIMSIKQPQAKMTMNGKDFPMPASSSADQTVFGKSTQDGKMSIDSISGKAMNDALKESVMKMITNLQANIKFPEKPMKIGDTFTQNLPMDIPMPGLNSKLDMNAAYKLLSIENGKANFSINFTIGMDMNSTKAPVSVDMKGDGDGKLLYDMATNYPSSMQENMNLVFSVAISQQNMKMKGDMKMIIDQQTTVATN